MVEQPWQHMVDSLLPDLVVEQLVDSL